MSKHLTRPLLPFLAAISAIAQTPPDTLPATTESLSVSYGSNSVTPGITFAPSDTRMIPSFSYRPETPDQTYILLFIDLSLPTSRVDESRLDPASQLPLAPGSPADRTTRLHFWQNGVTFASDGSLVNNSEPVAFYQGPSPPPGDIPHIYSFYLFEQGDAFAPPPAGNPFNTNNVYVGMTNRLSFNVQKFADQEGVEDLVAANYIKVQNTTGSAPSSTSSSSTGTASSSSGPVSKPSPSPFTNIGERLEAAGAWRLFAWISGGAAILLS